MDKDYCISEDNFVQYAPRKDGEKEDEDFRSFFGGEVYHDKRIGSKTISYRVTPSDSSIASMGNSEELTSDEETKGNTDGLKYKRRMSW